VTRRLTTRGDVAKLAGTSTAVVSYVINNGPRNVSPERRERVLAAMAALDYHPNAIARSLTATETQTLGMIVPNISNAYFAELALAVEEAAAKRDRLLFLGNSNETAEGEAAYISSFLEQRVDGIIIIGVALSSSIMRASHNGVRVVVVDRALQGTGSTTISIDHRSAAFTATAHLLEHGHRAIACLTGPSDQLVAEDRRLGWADALRGAGIEPQEQVQLRSAFSLEGGSSALDHLDTAAGIRPTAMFIASDEQARGVIAGARRANRVIPRDLAVVSVDGTREGEFSNPALTSVRQPYAQLATSAVESVLARGDDEPRHIVMDAELVIRQSCGCD
jgi:LacI family transcriptional regulator